VDARAVRGLPLQAEACLGLSVLLPRSVPDWDLTQGGERGRFAASLLDFPFRRPVTGSPVLFLEREQENPKLMEFRGVPEISAQFRIFPKKLGFDGSRRVLGVPEISAQFRIFPKRLPVLVFRLQSLLVEITSE
jgi:hypothetical protein